MRQLRRLGSKPSIRHLFLSQRVLPWSCLGAASERLRSRAPQPTISRSISAWRSATRRSASTLKSTSYSLRRRSTTRIECPNSSTVTAPKRCAPRRNAKTLALAMKGRKVDDRLRTRQAKFDLDYAMDDRLQLRRIASEWQFRSLDRLHGFRRSSAAAKRSINASRFWAAQANTPSGILWAATTPH